MNELTTVDQNFLDKFKVTQQERGSSTLRRVRMNSETAEIKWRVNRDDEWTIVPSINGVLVGVYKKYVFDKWDEAKKCNEYNFQSTEAPYSDKSHVVKILDKTDYENIKELGETPIGDINNWCINYQQNVRSKELGADPFITKKTTEKGEEIYTTFKVKYVLYVADIEENLYRLEVNSTARPVIENFMFANSGMVQFSKLISIGFTKDTPIKSNNGEYHGLSIEEGMVIDDVELTHKFYKIGFELYQTLIFLQNMKREDKAISAEPKRVVATATTAELPKIATTGAVVAPMADDEGDDTIELKDLPF